MTIGSTNSIIAHTDWYATIYVTTTAGTTVTVDGVSQVATEGYVEFRVYKVGTYVISGTLNGYTNTTTQYVSEAISYYVTLYMSATIRVNAPVNTVVTVGSESKTVTGTYVDFTVYSTGVLNGITSTNTVYVGSMGNTYSTTLVFGCYINIYSNVGTDVIYNGLRQTVGDTGYVRYWITSTGTYKFLCIYKGQSKEKAVVVTSIASDIDENIYFVPETTVGVTTHSLPPEYTYVKYIASTSAKTQYLNLGETGSDTTGMLIKVYEETTTVPKDNIFCGGRATQNGRFWVGANQTNASQPDYIYYGWNTLNRLDNLPVINATHTLRTAYVNYLNNRQQGYDDTKAFDLNQTLVQSTPIYAFAAYNNTSVGLNSWARLYYVVLTSGTSISNIFIPCYRNSDNVIGMYDIVKGNFKTNAGSGTFVYEEDT